MRKSVLMIDEGDECKKVEELLTKEGIPYVIYKIDKESSSSCCGGYTTKVPALFAPEGIYRGIEEISEYIKIAKTNINKESESAYW
jgi:glutaredoxin